MVLTTIRFRLAMTLWLICIPMLLPAWRKMALRLMPTARNLAWVLILILGFLMLSLKIRTKMFLSLPILVIPTILPALPVELRLMNLTGSMLTWPSIMVCLRRLAMPKLWRIQAIREP
nr:hypothetical protein YKMJLDLN_YKMJLDLN_CDS_0005 [Microvirus sp.]